MQGAPVPRGVTGAEMTDRRNPRSCVARTVEGPPTRTKKRTTQTHLAHGPGSLHHKEKGGRRGGALVGGSKWNSSTRRRPWSAVGLFASMSLFLPPPPQARHPWPAPGTCSSTIPPSGSTAPVPRIHGIPAWAPLVFNGDDIFEELRSARVNNAGRRRVYTEVVLAERKWQMRGRWSSNRLGWAREMHASRGGAS